MCDISNAAAIYTEHKNNHSHKSKTRDDNINNEDHISTYNSNNNNNNNGMNNNHGNNHNNENDNSND